MPKARSCQHRIHDLLRVHLNDLIDLVEFITELIAIVKADFSLFILQSKLKVVILLIIDYLSFQE